MSRRKRRFDRLDNNRSAILERAAVAYLGSLEKAERDRKDIEIIDRNARRLSRKANDVLRLCAALAASGPE